MGNVIINLRKSAAKIRQIRLLLNFKEFEFDFQRRFIDGFRRDQFRIPEKINGHGFWIVEDAVESNKKGTSVRIEPGLVGKQFKVVLHNPLDLTTERIQLHKDIEITAPILFEKLAVRLVGWIKAWSNAKHSRMWLRDLQRVRIQKRQL
ncbi:MAG: hypothetical protein MK085_04105 [Phycisphaerales bacterium]|nr:hypothetical protein [Phycisphaerales bacterium]